MRGRHRERPFPRRIGMVRVCKHEPPTTRLVTIKWVIPNRTVEMGDWLNWAVLGTCEYGNCSEWQCPICGCNNHGGAGPMECPCQDWIGFHDMRAKRPVAVKPSLRTNGARRRSTRRPR